MEDFSFRHRLTLHLLELFPQILLVALCNSRAMGEADVNSDIDLFIIAKKGNLWTVRFIVTTLTSMFGVRRRNTHGLQKWTPEYTARTKNKFCLSFFITEEVMNFASIRLEPNDPYLDRWIYTLIPIVNKNHTYEHFMEANWVEPTNTFMHSSWQLFWHKLGNIFWFFTLLENLTKKLWLPKTLKTYEKLGKPWWVVISDTMLKFHDQDVRREYSDAQL
jgi:predicted nucleotidyltransferase